MKTTPFYFLVELPGKGMALTWIGGGLKPSKRPGHVWLTTPAETLSSKRREAKFTRQAPRTWHGAFLPSADWPKRH